MVRKIIWLCAAVAGFGLAIERPSSEVQARRRCCNNYGYDQGCGGRHHRHRGCSHHGDCGNYGGCGQQQCGYQSSCQQGCAVQQGCSSGACGVQQNCGQGGCSVHSAGTYGSPTNYGAAYGPTPQGDFYGNQAVQQNTIPPAPAPDRATFDQRDQAAPPRAAAPPSPALNPSVETRVDTNVAPNVNATPNVNVAPKVEATPPAPPSPPSPPAVAPSVNP